MLLQTWIL
jgi:integrin beta 1